MKTIRWNNSLILFYFTYIPFFFLLILDFKIFSYFLFLKFLQKNLNFAQNYIIIFSHLHRIDAVKSMGDGVGG